MALPLLTVDQEHFATLLAQNQSLERLHELLFTSLLAETVDSDVAIYLKALGNKIYQMNAMEREERISDEGRKY